MSSIARCNPGLSLRNQVSSFRYQHLLLEVLPFFPEQSNFLHHGQTYVPNILLFVQATAIKNPPLCLICAGTKSSLDFGVWRRINQKRVTRIVTPYPPYLFDAEPGGEHFFIRIHDVIVAASFDSNGMIPGSVIVVRLRCYNTPLSVSKCGSTALSTTLKVTAYYNLET